MSEMFNKINFAQHQQELCNCPICGAPAEMYERKYDGRLVTTKAVMCSREEAFGPLQEGCILFLPPEGFYQSRYAEAAQVWTAFAAAVIGARK